MDGAVRTRPEASASVYINQVMEVLVCLAQQPGQVITRDQLLETVWAGTIVTDDVLTHAISELRKACEDDPKSPKVVQTIPRKGYRLIAAVERRRAHRLPMLTAIQGLKDAGGE